MGGYGSGQWYRWNAKNTTEGNLPLDIRALHRKGLLTPSGVFDYRWWMGEEPERGNRISGVVHDDRVELLYRCRNHAGEWEDVKETVRLDWTPCHYGGRRPWWLCPHCWRRVAVLYGAGMLFLCRHCYHLAYPSQRENRQDRLLRKAQKILMRLGGSGSIMDHFPLKPKGMHWNTYDRLRQQEKVAQHFMWRELKVWLDRLDASRNNLSARSGTRKDNRGNAGIHRELRRQF